ncbi:MAG: winged helix-turn-helix transcriptional regulator [Deltaproteobacteria bacterium]|nr:winged helix-turn-helix transcriptional regulator [Deltaproteobacteria bacterium]
MISSFPEKDVSRPWTFVTNHAVVLSCLAQHPRITAHEMVLEIDISERAIRRIIADLEEAGYITKEKEGRRVRYRVNYQSNLRHITQRDKVIGDLLKVLGYK